VGLGPGRCGGRLRRGSSLQWVDARIGNGVARAFEERGLSIPCDLFPFPFLAPPRIAAPPPHRPGPFPPGTTHPFDLRGWGRPGKGDFPRSKPPFSFPPKGREAPFDHWPQRESGRCAQRRWAGEGARGRGESGPSRRARRDRSLPSKVRVNEARPTPSFRGRRASRAASRPNPSLGPV